MTEAEVYHLDGEEIAIVRTQQVSCDGGSGALGHPVEYLTLERGGETVCKYCDRRFLRENHPKATEARERGQRIERPGVVA